MRNSILKKYIILNSNEKQYLYGKVYNDNRFPNGHLILTTKIIELNKEENFVITENKTKYKLEEKLSKEEFIQMIKEDYVDPVYIKFILTPLENINIV